MPSRAPKSSRVRNQIVGALLISLVTSLTPIPSFLPGLPVQVAFAAGTTARVSTSLSGGEANGGSAFTSVSADGRYVAFASFATNLVDGDTTGGTLLDVFVRDTSANQTTRVSVSSAGVQGNNTSTRPSISANGAFVAYSSAASNLVSGDTNSAQDVFVHDRSTGATSRVSVSTSGTQGNATSIVSSHTAISSDGRYVAFASDASNLVTGDTNATRDAFVHDRSNGVTTRVSVSTAGVQGNGPTGTVGISSDGRYVVFSSEASTLVSGDTNGAVDVFLRDLQAGTTTRVSVSANGSQASGGGQDPAISGDGAVVAFHSASADLVPGDMNGANDVFVKYVATGAINLVSLHSSGAQANGPSLLVAISGDGLVVAFESSATNLVDGDTNAKTDVFIRALQTGITSRASISNSGTEGNGNSTQASISQSGRYVAFSSDATNLVEPDTNVATDVFFHDTQGVVADFGTGSAHTFGINPLFAYSKDPVNLATGVFTASAADLAMPGRVLSLSFTRSYNSADDRGGPLGEGWTHSYNWTLADAGATVELRRGDGSRDTFTRNPDGTYLDPPNVFDTLVKNGDGTFTLTLTSQLQYEFSTTGTLTRIHEPAGNQIALAYTGANLTGITDTVGRQITLAYDGSNRLTQVQDPLGRKVTYAFDANGRLSTVTDKIGNATGQNPALHRWTYGYDGTTRHIRTITDPDGRVRVTNTYDSQGRVFQQRDALNALTQISYSAGQSVLTDPRLHATTFTFDARMRVLTQADVVGANTYTITYVYDAAGNRTSITDRNGKTTDFTYDMRGNVLTKTDPQINPQTPRYLTQFGYDAKNNLTSVTDARSFVTTLTYQPTTNVLLSVSRQIDGVTSAITKYEYADAASPGLPSKVIAPRGNTGPSPNYLYATSLTYDAQGNLTQRIDPDSARTTFAYDTVGRLASFVDPDGYAAGADPLQHTWTVAYDEDDRETSRTDPLGDVLRYAYDGAGNRTTLTDRRGNITTYIYDPNTRLSTVQQKPDPVGEPTLVYTTQVTRDLNGNATRITQANAVATDYVFDALDRLTSVSTHPDAQTTLTTFYVLDGNGQPTSRTSGDNVTVNYTYDALSRPSTVSGPSLSISYAYDPTSLRTQMIDVTGTTTYLYDGLGRPTQVAAPNGTLTYAYDLDGNRTTLGYPGSQNVTYAYSPGGRLNTVTDWASRLSTYTYKPSGLVSTLSYPNTMLANYTYDRAQRLTQITNAVGATTVTQHTYTLDAEGNRTALDEYVQGLTQPVQTWSASVQVNDVATGQQDRPDIALGADGATYLIWDDYRTGGQGDIYFSRRDPTTGTWSANQKVNDDVNGGTQYNAAIALDASNNAYAVWQDPRQGTIKNVDYNIFFSKRSAATGVWSANVRINDDTSGRAVQTSARIAVKSAGDAVAVWEDHRSNQWNVYSSRLVAGGSTWAANLRVTDNTVSRKFTPDLAVGADGTAYAVWEDDRSGNSDIWFSTLPAGSSTWSANVKISDDPGTTAQYDPQIRISAAGDLIVIWQDDRVPNTEVRMRRRLAGQSNWQTSIVASDAAAIPVSLALGVRSDGNAFAAWQDARGSSYDIWGADYTFATNSWSAVAIVSDDPGSAAQMRPAAAMSLGEVAVAWRDDRVTGGDIRERRRTVANGTDHFTFAYDGLSRLTSVGGPTPETFSFDAASNIASRTGPPASNAYDGANRQTTDGSRAFVWDGADRLIASGPDTFSYDALARLVSATVGGNTKTYAYDGDGLRRDSALLWDTSVAPAALVQSATERIVSGLEGPLYFAHSDNSTVTLARDGLGSVRAEIDAAGAVARSSRYTAFGSLAVSQGGSPTLLGYTSEPADATGLTYLRARWYDPQTGRFLTRDPMPGSVVAPATLNLYVYVAANPVNRQDPSGRVCLPCIGALIGAGAGLGGYWASTVVTGHRFDVGQALIATGTGAIAGAACTGGVIAGCVAVSAAVSAIQYGLAPGEKSLAGFAVAGSVGAVAGRWSYSRTLGGPYYEGPLIWDKKLLDGVGVGFDWAKSIAGNFLRSFGASTAGSLSPNLVTDTAFGADIGSGPVAGAGGMTK